jgi:hypothetical protein
VIGGYVGSDCFSGCTALTTVEIGGCVGYGLSCFSNCTSLTTATVGGDVSNNAFSGCAKLKSVRLLNGVTSIGIDAFSGCTQLADVHYAGTEAQWSRITVKDGNDWLTSASIHYSSNAPAIAGSVSGAVLTYGVANAPAYSLLIAARYDGGRMTCVRTLAVRGNQDGPITMGGSGAEYRLMLVNASCAPLCAAWSGNG